MRDYAELITRLKQSDDNCNAECCECSGECLSSGCNIFSEAADAIEELLGQHEADAKEIAWLKKCVQDLPKPQKWISVKKQLPKDGEFVLVCNDDGHMMIAKHESEVLEWYYKYTNYDFDIWENEEQGPICYWMPLPEPPKGVE